MWSNDEPDELQAGTNGGKVPTVRPSPDLSGYREMLALAARMPPRDLKMALVDAKRTGGLLGQDGFYQWKVNRKHGGSTTIVGPSARLAYALARDWGRCATRVTLLSEEGGQVSMCAQYIDLSTMFLVERPYAGTLSPAPAGFSKDPEQAERWHTMQLQAAASKAVRGAILQGLPGWYVEAGLNAARDQAAQDATDGKALPEARKAAVEHLGQQGLTREDLEAYLNGIPLDMWASAELSDLRELARQLRRGETTAAAIQIKRALQPTAPADVAQDKLAGLGLQPATTTPASLPTSTLPTSTPTPAAPPPGEPANTSWEAQRGSLEERKALLASCQAAERELTPDLVLATRRGCNILNSPNAKHSAETLTEYLEALGRAIDASLPSEM